MALTHTHFLSPTTQNQRYLKVLILSASLISLPACTHAEEEQSAALTKQAEAPSINTPVSNASVDGANMRGDVKPVKTSGINPRYRFAAMDEAVSIVTREDEYTARLQPLEIGVKNRDSQKTTLADLQKTYSGGILEWSDEERTAIIYAIQSIQQNLRPFERHLPETVLMAKTSQAIEGGLPHTRSNLILFSQESLDEYSNTQKNDKTQAQNTLAALFLHELHHVLSRHQAIHRDAYFSLIGFVPCRFEEPKSLLTLRLTNPDAPAYGHYVPIKSSIGNTNTNGVIPYLRITGPYNDQLKGELGDYFDFGLLAVSANDATCTIAIKGNNTSPDNQQPLFLNISDAPAFFEAIGKNTGYIIHPEEILAENFTYEIQQRDGLANPEIPDKIKTFWDGIE